MRRSKLKYKNIQNVDNYICQENGIYCPSFNLTHKQLIKAGNPYPLYHGKIVRWLLVAKISNN